jgi:type II secretory pathway component PulF
MVRVGEEGGALPAMLRQIGDYLQTARDIQHRLRKTLTYPFVVWLILLFQALILLLFVFPKMAELSSLMGGESEPYFDLMTKLGPAALILGGGLLLFLAWLAVSAVGGAVEGGGETPSWLDRLALNMPFFGALNRHAKTAEVCEMLSVLIESGRSTREAIMIAKQAANGASLQLALEEVEAALASGQEYRGSGKPTLIPHATLWMLCRSNGDPAIADNLRSLARLHRRQMDSTASLLRETLDPVLLIAVAIMAGVMLVTLYYTMFDISANPLRHIMY